MEMLKEVVHKEKRPIMLFIVVIKIVKGAKITLALIIIILGRNSFHVLGKILINSRELRRKLPKFQRYKIESMIMSNRFLI
jgi:hypothetical protein